MKKNGTAPMEMIVIILIVLIFAALFLWIFGPKELMGKIRDLAVGLADKYLPDKSPENVKPDMSVPKEAGKTYDNLLSAIKSSDTNSEPRCLIYYKEAGGVNDDYLLTMAKSGEDMLVKLTNPKGQTILTETLSNKEPCIVGGNSAAVNFYSNHVDPGSGNNEPEYTSFPSITTTGLYNLIADGKSYDIEDEGLSDKNNNEINILYKVDEKHICFFTTYNWGWNQADQDGMNDDVLKKILPNGNKPIKLCSQDKCDFVTC